MKIIKLSAVGFLLAANLWGQELPIAPWMEIKGEFIQKSNDETIWLFKAGELFYAWNIEKRQALGRYSGLYACINSNNKSIAILKEDNSLQVVSLEGNSNSNSNKAAGDPASPQDNYQATPLSVKAPKNTRTYYNAFGYYNPVVFQNDRLYLIHDFGCTVWSVSEKRELKSFQWKSQAADPPNAYLSPDGEHLIAGVTQNNRPFLVVLNTRSWAQTEIPLNDEKTYIKSVIFSQDGGSFLAYLSSGKKVYHVSIRSKQVIGEFAPSDQRESLTDHFFVSEDHSKYGMAEKGTIKVYDLNEGRVIRTMSYERSDSSQYDHPAVMTDPRGEKLSFENMRSPSKGNSRELWDMTTGKRIRTLDRNVGCAMIAGDFMVLHEGPGLAGRHDVCDLKAGQRLGTLEEFRANFMLSDANAPGANITTNGKFAYGRDFNSRGTVSWYALKGVMPASSVMASIDHSGPKLEILEPAASRGFKVTQKSLTVKGIALDASGVYEVLVNGVPAKMAANGEFLAEVKLAVGENTIKIKATDIKDNITEQSFVVERPAEIAGSDAGNTAFGLLKGKYYAVVIGVQNYADNSITKLDYPVQDAQNVLDELTSDYLFDKSNCYFLKDPDRKAILKMLNNLSKVLTPEDNVLIFYAGHGYWDEQKKQGYWLPSNSSADDPSNWISNSDLKDNLIGIKTKHTLVISDACFSGGIFKSREAFANSSVSVQETYKLPSRRALTSGALKTVPDKSPFVEYLLKGLKENTEKFLYSEKLYFSIKDNVTNNSKVRQTPLYGVIQEAGDEGGDFIFVRR